MERDEVILLDTHVLVRYWMGDKNLGRRSLAAIDKALASDELFVSAISFWFPVECRGSPLTSRVRSKLA